MHNNTLVSGVFTLRNPGAADAVRSDSKQRAADSGEFRKALESERNNSQRRKLPGKAGQRESSAAANGGDHPERGGPGLERDGRSVKVSRNEAAATDQQAAPSVAEQPLEMPTAGMQTPLDSGPQHESDPAFSRLVSGVEPDAMPALLLDLPLNTQVSLNTLGEAVSGIAMQWGSGKSGDNEGQLPGNPVAELIRLIAAGDDRLLPPSGSEAPQTREDMAALLANGLLMEGRLADGRMPGISNGQIQNRQHLNGQASYQMVSAPGFGKLTMEFLQAQLSTTGRESLQQPVPAGDTQLPGLSLLDDARLQTRTQLSSLLLERSGQATASLAGAGVETLQDALGINGEAKTGGLQQALDAIPLSTARATAGATLPTPFSMPDQVRVALGQPQWHAAVADRVMMMAAQRLSSAEIQLDPPELGQLQVRVTLNHEQAHVSFVSHHAAVREALDQTAYRLRDMFENEGLNLVDVDVSDQSFAGEQQQSETGTDAGPGAGVDQVGGPAAEPVFVSNRLVDQFV